MFAAMWGDIVDKGFWKVSHIEQKPLNKPLKEIVQSLIELARVTQV